MYSFHNSLISRFVKLGIFYLEENSGLASTSIFSTYKELVIVFPGSGPRQGDLTHVKLKSS